MSVWFGWLVCVKWHGVLEGCRNISKINRPHTQPWTQEWMSQLPRHLFAKPPRKNVCQDAAKIIEPKLDDTQCGVFVAVFAAQNKFPHFVTKTTGLKPVKPGMTSNFSESRDPSYVCSAMCPKCLRKERQTKSFRLQSTRHSQESGPKFAQGPGGVITSLTLFGPVLVWSQQNYLKLVLIVRYCESS